MKLIYPRWPKLPEQTEFHLPPHGPVLFSASVPNAGPQPRPDGTPVVRAHN
jgi:hypothetical protein